MGQVDAVSKAQLLVADDDGLVLATLSMGLRKIGYTVIEASSGKEAIKLCQSHKPDLALLDMRMPDLSGLEVAREVRLADGIPYMFLSAFDDAEIVDTAVSEGALGYLVKPIDVHQIVPAIEAALQRAGEIKGLQDSRDNLSNALNSGRETNVAIGILMAQTALSYSEAEQALRKYARSNRKRMNEIAVEIINASNTLSDLINSIREYVGK